MCGGGACGVLSHRSRSTVATGNRRTGVRYRRVLHAQYIGSIRTVDLASRAPVILRFKYYFPSHFRSQDSSRRGSRDGYILYYTHDILFPRQRYHRPTTSRHRRTSLFPAATATITTTTPTHPPKKLCCAVVYVQRVLG